MVQELVSLNPLLCLLYSDKTLFPFSDLISLRAFTPLNSTTTGKTPPFIFFQVPFFLTMKKAALCFVAF